MFVQSMLRLNLLHHICTRQLTSATQSSLYPSVPHHQSNQASSIENSHSHFKHYHQHSGVQSVASVASTKVSAINEMVKYEEPLVHQPKGEHTASMIIMHGLGDSAYGWVDMGHQFGRDLPHVKFIFPTAPQMPVTLNNGLTMNSWYDIYSLDRLIGQEDTENLKASSAYIQQLVEKEIAAGIPSERILVAGFSQGGALALLSLRQPHKLAGVLSMSAYLTMEKETLVSEANKETPLLMCHGEADQVVQFRFGQMSHEYLKKAGVNVEFKSYPGMGHTLGAQELRDIDKYLKTHLPSK